MTRTTLDRELQRLQDEMVLMTSVVSRAIGEAVDALRRQDLDAAARLTDADEAIDRQRYAIESDCWCSLHGSSPATDLRTLAAILEIASELERIGDYAKGLPRSRGWYGTVSPSTGTATASWRPRRRTCSTGRWSLFCGGILLARSIPHEDDQVDELVQSGECRHDRDDYRRSDQDGAGELYHLGGP